MKVILCSTLVLTISIGLLTLWTVGQTMTSETVAANLSPNISHRLLSDLEMLDNQSDKIWRNHRLANSEYIWLSSPALLDGSGYFVDSGQNLGTFSSTAIALGDLDGDTDLDALVGNTDSQYQ